MSKNMAIHPILVGFTALMLLGILAVPEYSDATSSRDARIITNMGQLRSVAEIINANEESYENVHCDHEGDMKILCEDIKRRGGKTPIIYSSEDAYCAYTFLPPSGSDYGEFYCIDSANFSSLQLKNSPGQQGYCDGTTFSCIVDGVEPPFYNDPYFVEELREVGSRETSENWFMIHLLAIFLFFVGVWFRAFHLRKKEIHPRLALEGYAAIISFILLWGTFLGSISEILIMVYPIGLGMSISCLIHKGRMNKIVGGVLTLIYAIIFLAFFEPEFAIFVLSVVGFIVGFRILIFLWKWTDRWRMQEPVKDTSFALTAKVIGNNILYHAAIIWFVVHVSIVVYSTAVLNIPYRMDRFSVDYELYIKYGHFISVALLAFATGFRAVKKNVETKMLAWESYAGAWALSTLWLFWVVLIFDLIHPSPFSENSMPILVILLILSSIFGIKCLLHRGRLNNLHGLGILIGTILLAMYILKSLKYL
jgi:hypothetical protein